MAVREELLRSCKEAVDAITSQQHREALANGLAALKADQKPAWFDYSNLPPPLERETAVAVATRAEGAVPRISMEPREKEAAVCVPGPSEIVFAIKLPMLVNAEAVKKGEELAWEATAKQNAHGKTKTPEETWRIDEAREAKEKGKAAGSRRRRRPRRLSTATVIRMQLQKEAAAADEGRSAVPGWDG